MIEYITGLASHKLNDEERGEYPAFARRVLDAPTLIWSHAFDRQLDDVQRALVIALVSISSKATLDDLERAWVRFAAAAEIELRGQAFKRSLCVLDETFLKTHRDVGRLFVEPANPSIVDFVATWLQNSPREASAAVNGAVFFEQLPWLKSSVVDRAPPGRASELAVSLANAVERCWGSKNPAWQQVHYGSIHSPLHTSPGRVETARRLIFVNRLLDGGEPFITRLGGWFEQRLADEAERWRTEHVQDVSSPVALAEALAHSNRAGDEILTAAKEFVAGRLTAIYGWRQLLRLRRATPRLYGQREWADLKDQFAGFAGDALEDPGGIDDLEDIESLESIAYDIGVSLDEDDLDHARDVVSEHVYDQEERAHIPDEDEGQQNGLGHLHGTRESAQIEALFARLRNS